MNRTISARAVGALLATWRALLAALVTVALVAPPIAEARAPAAVPLQHIAPQGAEAPSTPSIGTNAHFYFPLGGAAAPASYVGPASNNTVLGIGSLTTNQATQITIHQTHVVGGINDLRVGLLRANSGTGRTTPIASAYVVNEISVRLVSGGPVTKLTKAGATSWTVTPWNGTNSDPVVDWSDLTPLAANIPANTDFYLFVSVTVSGGTQLPGLSSAGAQMIASDEYLNTGAGALTTMPATASSVGQTDANRRTRLTVVGGLEATRTGDSVAIIGDSITLYASSNIPLTDGNFADHNRGLVPNMLGSTVVGSGFDYVNLGIGGDQWETRTYDTRVQEALYANATTVVLALGVNSFNNKNQPCTSSTACVPFDWLRNYLPKLNGKKVVLTEITPQTTGIWTAADGSDQTYATLGSGNVTNVTHPAYNGALATLSLPILAVRSAFALSTDANKWHADSTTNFSTQDGLHPKKAALLRATTSYGAIAQSLVAGAPVMTGVARVSRPLVGATISGGFMTNGTGVQNAIVPGNQYLTIIVKVTLPASIASAHALLGSSSTTSWGIKAASIAPTTGLVTFTAYGGANSTPTIGLNFGAENELMWVLDGTNIYQFINGAFDCQLAISANGGLRTDFKIAADSAKSIKLRELTIWNYPLQTSGSYTPTTFSGGEAGLIARYPLSTDANPIYGPGMP